MSIVGFRNVSHNYAGAKLPDGGTLAGMEEHALLVRPELQVQDLQRHISANNVRREFAAFFPRIDANGSFNWASNSRNRGSTSSS